MQEDRIIEDHASALAKDVALPDEHALHKPDESLLVGSVTTVPNMPSVPNMPNVGNVGTLSHVGNAVDVKVEESSGDGLIEVREAMRESVEVFNRVKSEKIAEQALCSIRNDQAQYQGLAKEIVGKAIKQKERERANRASAAASRAKVMRYQTELERRLNRVEAERNAYQRELQELKGSGDEDRRETADLEKQFSKLQGWLKKMEAANPEFVRSIIAQDEMDMVLGDKRSKVEDDGLDMTRGDDQGDAKKPRLSL